MGAGPQHLLRSGLVVQLEKAGHRVTARTLDLPPDARLAEIAAAFELSRAVAQAAAETIATGAFPLVLSGNCGPAAMGCVAALAGRTAVFWFDAHGDFNTPETTVSGFLDGMALAAITGRCWTRLVREIPGFTAVREDDVVAIGVRDLDAEEAVALQASSVRRVGARTLRHELSTAMAERHLTRKPAYLHVDLDVLDPSEGRVNQFSTPGGLQLSELRWAMETIANGCQIRAASLTAFDPASDDTGRASLTAVTAAVMLVDAVSRHRRDGA
jgi:arginase